jgi:hypothetical protein
MNDETAVPGLCQAQISISVDCPKPALPGKQFCHFHDGLVGPWAKAAVAVKKARPILLNPFRKSY